MRIVVFHQPEPVGNFHAHTFIAKKFIDRGHEVYLLEQLHGRPYNQAYVQQIIDLDPDIIYFEMLDFNTFDVVRQLKGHKVLNYCSRGVLKSFHEILDYHGHWYDTVITNSPEMNRQFNKNGILSELFEFYYLQITEQDLIYTPEYDHNVTFLGIGFGRLDQPEYQIERDLFFFNQSLYNEVGLVIWGNGWPKTPNHRGILPHGHIGRLYTSAKSAISIIEPNQRKMGMINNRYPELAFCQTPFITYDYSVEGVDWFGADKYMNFVKSPQEAVDTINRISKRPDDVMEKAKEFKEFIIKKDEEYYEKLHHLTGI